MSLSPKTSRILADRLKKIEGGKFDPDDILFLLIQLRDHLKHDSIIKEMAHFIAHPTRNQGITVKTATMFGDRIKVAMELIQMRFHGSALNLNILPSHMYSVLIDYFSTRHPNASIKKIIEQSYFDNKDGTFITKGQLPPQLVDYIKHAFSMLDLKTTLDQSDLIKDLSDALVTFGFSNAKKIVSDNKEEVMLCILYLLHQSVLVLPNGGTALIFLGQDHLSEDKPCFHIFASITPKNSNISFVCAIITSTVSVEGQLSTNLFKTDFKGDYDEDSHLELERDSEGQLRLNKN